MKKTIVLAGLMVMTLTFLTPLAKAEDAKADNDASKEAVAAATGAAEAVQADAPKADPVIAPEPEAADIAADAVDAVKAPEAPAAPAAAVEAPAAAAEVSAAWKSYPPEIVVSKWGSEIKIVFTPSNLMKEDERLAIQTVKLESEAGEFLGLKTYTGNEKDRVAEFMVNPEALKIETAKVTVASSKDGNFVKVISLKPEEASAAEAAAAPAAAEGVKAEVKSAPAPEKSANANKEAKPKKKGWPW